MTGLEQVFGGIIIAVGGTGLGGLIFGKNKLTKEEFQELCSERQHHCTALMCVELKHLRESQEEVKRDMKAVLKKISDNPKIGSSNT